MAQSVAAQPTAQTAEREPDAIRRISRREGSALLDRQARKYLDMSGDDFRRRYQDGSLDVEDTRVIRVSFLLPLAER